VIVGKGRCEGERVDRRRDSGDMKIQKEKECGDQARWSTSGDDEETKRIFRVDRGDDTKESKLRKGRCQRKSILVEESVRPMDK
jgi:hypothetical protein